MGDKNDKYAPVKRFVFPAGDCGGEIRINIPVTASKSDVIRMARMLMVAAEDWEDAPYMVDVMGEEEASKYVLENMANEIAHNLAPFISVEARSDPYMNVKIVRGKVRIVDPSFRF